MSAFEVVPLEHIGAEIAGLDPRAMTDEVERNLYDVWMEYGVRLFREAAPDPVEAHWPMMTAVSVILAVLVIGWMVVRRVLLDGGGRR